MMIESKVACALTAIALISWLSGCGGNGGTKEAEKKEAVKAKDHKDRVLLSPEAMKNASIKVITINAESLPDTIRATANIAHNQDRSF